MRIGPNTGHVFMAMLVFRSNAMILNQPVDRWSQATQAASGSAPLLGHMPLGRHVGGAWQSSEWKAQHSYVEQCRVRLMWLKTRWCQLKLAHLSEKLGLVYSKDLSNWKSVHHQTWHTCLYASVPAYCLVLWVSLHLLWSHPSPAPTSHILISPWVHTLSWFTVAMPGHDGEREYYLGCSVEKKRSMTCRIVEIISVWWVCWCGQRDQNTFSMFKGWNSNKHLKLHCLHMIGNYTLSVCW